MKHKIVSIKAYSVEIDNISFGIIDSNNKIAYMQNPNSLKNNSNLFKNSNRLMKYASLINSLRKKGISIKYWQANRDENSFKAYDIL